MRFVPGCNCCCHASIIFHVKSCGSGGPPIPGVTITVKDSGGATVDTGTTDASGNYTTAALTCAAYTWTATLTGWVSDSGSKTITTNGVNVTVNSTGMRPSTITLTDANTTISLTWNAGGFWEGCYTLSQSDMTFTAGANCTLNTCTPGTSSSPVYYQLFCTSGTAYSLQQNACRIGECCPPGPAPCTAQTTFCSGTCGGGSGFACSGSTGCSSINQTVAASGTYNPLSLTYTFSLSTITVCGTSTATWTGPANGGVTITL